MKRARPSYARATPALKPSDWLPRFGYGTGAMLRATADHPNAATHTLCAPAKIPSPERAYPKFLPSRGVTSGPGVPTGCSLPGATTSHEFKTPQTTIRSGCIRHAAKAISGVSIPGTPAQIPGDFWPAVIFIRFPRSLGTSLVGRYRPAPFGIFVIFRKNGHLAGMLPCSRPAGCRLSWNVLLRGCR